LAADQVGEHQLDAAGAFEIAHHQPVAAPAPAFDQSAVFELANGLAQGRAADAVALAQVPFGAEALPGAPAPLHVGSDPAGDDRGERAVPVLAFGLDRRQGPQPAAAPEPGIELAI